MGNITLISQSTGSYYPLVAYAYDSQNQLIKETYYDGEGTGSAHVTDTYEYTYDTAGNILSEKKNGTVTKTYTYGDSQWNDLLTEYNDTTISYDAIGNPLIYPLRDDVYNMTWEQGRQLTSISKENVTMLGGYWTMSFQYDANGIRTEKQVPHGKRGHYIVYSYVTQNGRIVRQSDNCGDLAQIWDFIYDESGRPFALNYSDNNGDTFTTYYYVLNLQGDVVKLIDENGTTYASYTYDAWGNVLTATGSMAYINPLRYRGYYCDNETGFYYLQSRYYDPATHRFINADSFASTDIDDPIAANMFAYCGNNPVRRLDSIGMWWGEDVWDWACGTVSEAWEWVEEKASIVWKKAKGVANAIYESIELEFGVGLGLYVGCSILEEVIGINLGLYENVFAIQLKKGNVRVGTDFCEAATASIPFLPTFGASSGFFQEYGSDERESYSWSKYEKEKESVDIFGAGAYFFIGARINIGFNTVSFFEALDEIF